MSEDTRASLRSEFIRLSLCSWVTAMHGESADAARRATVQHECEFITMLIEASMKFGEIWATSAQTTNYVGVGDA